jgi:hypothetical protein
MGTHIQAETRHSNAETRTDFQKFGLRVAPHATISGKMQRRLCKVPGLTSEEPNGQTDIDHSSPNEVSAKHFQILSRQQPHAKYISDIVVQDQCGFVQIHIDQHM